MEKQVSGRGGVVTQEILFESGKGGYTAYRIPSLVVSARGTVLAFCEGRRDSLRDYGQIDIMMRRSSDNGRTWENPRVILTQGGMTCGNPAPVVDAQSGMICLLFCKNNADGGEDSILKGKAPRSVWITRSTDDGETWSEPEDLTGKLKRKNWTWYATGPGHGVQLKSGRLLVSCNHIVGVNYNAEDPNHSHLVYSDDRGVTWSLGGICEKGSNESAVVETMDGSVYVNSRNPQECGRRTFSWSRDGGLSFGPRQVDDTLIEPPLWRGCQASMARYAVADGRTPSVILFANPACREEVRQNLTVRASYDECKTWSPGIVLHPGPSAYSDLAVAKDKTILCLYERGEKHPYETLALARFDIDCLKEPPLRSSFPQPRSRAPSV